MNSHVLPHVNSLFWTAVRYVRLPITRVLLAVTSLLWINSLLAAPIAIDNIQRAEPVSFEDEILPLLRQNCLACHSASEKQGDLVLESPQGVLKGGDSGPAAIPGKGADSLLLKAASHQIDPVMPPAGNDVAARNLTAAELGLLKLWIDQGAKGSSGIERLSPQQWAALPVGVHPVQALALTEDGQYVAASRANQIFLYHIPTGTLITRFSDPALATLVPAVATPMVVEPMAATTETVTQSIEVRGIAHRDLVQSLAFNADGDLLASGGFREVKLWRRPRDVVRHRLALGAAGTALAVSPDRNWIATAGTDNQVRLFNATTAQPGPILAGHVANITSLRFTADSTRLVSGSLDQSVRVWQISDGAALGVIETPAIIQAVELVNVENPTAEQPWPTQLLVTGHGDNLLRVWKLPTAPTATLATSLPNLERTAISTDGRLLAQVDNAGTLRVVSLLEKPEMPLGKELATWKIDQGVTALTFVRLVDRLEPTSDAPAQGHLLATGSLDGFVRLWSLPEHTLLAAWRGDSVAVKSLAASADGKLLATGLENGSITQWDLSTTLAAVTTLNAVPTVTEFARDTQSPLSVMALSPSRKLLACVGVLNGQPAVYVRNLESKQLVATFVGHQGAIRSLAFTADETGLVSGGDDRSLRLWNVQNPGAPEQAKLENLPAVVTAVAANNDGSQLLAGFADNALRLYFPKAETPEGLVLKEFVGNTGAILATGYFAGQPYSVSVDRTVRFWNAADGAQTRTFQLPANITALALSADTQRMAVAGDDKQVRIVQTDNGNILQTLSGFTQPGIAVSFSADAQQLAVLATGGELSLWNVPTQRLLEATVVAPLTSIAFTTATAPLLTADNEGRLATWSPRFQRHCDGNAQPVTALLYHPNGQVLLMTALDGSFRGYNTQNGQQTFATGHGAAVHSLALSPDGNVLATAGENAVVRLWNTSGGGYGPQQLTGFSGPVSHVTFSADGLKVIAAGEGDKPALHVHELQTGALLERFVPQGGRCTGCFALPLLPGVEASQQSLRFLSATPTAVVSQAVTAVRQISGHGGPVTSLAAIPENPRQVFAGSTDTTIRRWTLDNGQAIQQFNHGGPVVAIAVRPDGQRLASASDNHTAKLFNINGQQIAELRGDVRRRLGQTRAQQQLNAAVARLNAAKQLQMAAEQDVPVKTAAEKTLSEALAKANQEVVEKQAAVEKSLAEKIAAEKEAIEASGNAKLALAEKELAELAARTAVATMQVAQAKMQRLTQASAGEPLNEELKQLVAGAQTALTMCQEQSQAATAAIQPPTQKAQQMADLANTAAQKVNTVQKPYNDALAALKLAQANQNLISQQQVLAASELKVAQDLLPIRTDAVTKAEAAQAEAQKLVEAANLAAQEADLAIRAIAFSPDGQLLATAGDFPSVHTWDGETGGALGAFAGHEGPLKGVLFQDAQTILSLSEDQSARAWELNPGWILERTNGSVDDPNQIVHRVTALDFNSDASQLIVASGVPSRSGELQVYNVADGKRLLYLPQAHDDVVYSARFSPDGKRIASGGADKYLRTFDVATSQQLRRFEGHTNYVLGVDWKGDGQVLVSAGADNTVKVWDAEAADQRLTIENQFAKHVTAVQFMGESDSIITSCGDKLVRMFNVSNGGLQRNFGEIKSWTHCVAITSDGLVVVAGDALGHVTIWNGQNGQLQKQLPPPDQQPQSASATK